MHRREFIGRVVTGAVAARFGDDILKSETDRLAGPRSQVAQWVDEWLELHPDKSCYDFFSPKLMNYAPYR